MSGLPSPTPTNTLSVPVGMLHRPPIDEESEATLDLSNNCWEGLVLLQDFANFEVSVKPTDPTFSPETFGQFPANFHIAGRIDPGKALAYLESIKGCPTREIHPLIVKTIDEHLATSGSNSDPRKLIDYLQSTDRWGVVAVDSKRTNLRDLYLIPSAQLEKYKQRLMHIIDRFEQVLHDPKQFLAILVISAR